MVTEARPWGAVAQTCSLATFTAKLAAACTDGSKNA